MPNAMTTKTDFFTVTPGVHFTPDPWPEPLAERIYADYCTARIWAIQVGDDNYRITARRDAHFAYDCACHQVLAERLNHDTKFHAALERARLSRPIPAATSATGSLAPT